MIGSTWTLRDWAIILLTFEGLGDSYRLYEGAICIVLAAGFSKVEQARDPGCCSKGPCTRMYIHWPQCTYKGTTLRPKYILFGYMDPWGLSPGQV